MKEIYPRLTQPFSRDNITYNLRTKPIGTESISEVRDVVISNRDAPVNVTYNSPISSITSGNKIDLPDASSYIINDKKISNIIKSVDFEKTVTSIPSLKRIIIYSPKTKDLTEVIEVLKWSSKYNTSTETEELLTLMCSYKDVDVLRADPYLKSKFKLQIPKEGYMTYQIPIDNKSIACKYYNYEKQSLNSTVSEQATFRFGCGIHNAYIAYVNKNSSLGRKMLDGYLRNANTYMNISSKNAENYFDVVTNYIGAVNNIVVPQYQKLCIMRCYDHIINHHEPSMMAMNLLVENEDCDTALQLFHDFKNKHGSEPKVLTNSKSCQTYVYLSLGSFALREKDDPFSTMSFYKLAYENRFDASVSDTNRHNELINMLYNITRVYDTNYCNKLIESLPEPLKTLLSLHNNNLMNIHMSDIEGLNKKQIPEEFHDILALVQFIAKQKEPVNSKISSNETFYQELIELKKQKVEIRTLIDVSLGFRKMDVAQKLFESLKMTEILSDSSLFTQFIFCHASANSDCFLTIEKASVDPQQKSAKHFEAATASILENDNQLAQKYLERAIELEPQNESYIEAAMFNSVLMGNNENAEKYKSELIGMDKNHEINKFNNVENVVSSTIIKDEIDIEETYPTPEEIHQKFQLIKEQKLCAASKIQAENKWYLEENISIDIKDTIFLGEYRGLEYWGVLSDKFETKWYEHKNVFLAALKKGFVLRNEGQNGVKVLSNKLFEIKINSDLRAFTNKAYYNSNKKLLLRFEHVGNHEEIKRFANKNKLIFVDVAR